MNKLDVRLPNEAARALGGHASTAWPCGIATTAELPASASLTTAPETVIEALDVLETVIADFTAWVQNVQGGGQEGATGPARQDGGAGHPEPGFDDRRWREGCHRAILARSPTVVAVDRMLDDVRTAAPEEFIAAALEIIAGLHRASGELWSLLVSIDPLTGLGNRPAMVQRLAIESERHARNREPCCLAIVDIDRFKWVNDTHGHAAGDDVLRAVAGVLAGSLRPYDAISRFGGEEFVVCLPNADSRTAWAIAERLRLKVSAEPLQTRNGTAVRVTVSIGIAPLNPEMGVDAALQRADAALYIAKRDGRNAVVVSEG
jgi:diguanylate cyclase (GGDEF)-like protein